MKHGCTLTERKESESLVLVFTPESTMMGWSPSIGEAVISDGGILENSTSQE